MEKHIVSNILIFNKSGELALQMRAKDDKSFPGYWDFSAGGHIDVNETSQIAAERETFEELGVTGKIEFVSKLNLQYPGWNSHIMRDVDASVFKMTHNGPFIINSNEVAKVSFFKLADIQKMIDAKEKIHPEFILIWKQGIVARAAEMK